MTEENLPNDIKSLKTIIIQQYQTIQQLNETLQKLQAQMEWFQRYFFGSKSERGSKIQVGDPMPAKTTAKVKPNAASSTTKANGRRKLPEHLPREIIELDLSESKKRCSCGRTLHHLGYDISEQLEFIPAKLYVKQYKRYKYGCRGCAASVVSAELPPSPIEKGLAGPGLLTELIVSKYADALPLYRQEKRWERLGYVIPRTTQCDWMSACAELLRPLYEYMKTQVLQSNKIHTDDTVMPVLAPDKTHKGRLWVYIGGDHQTPDCTVFEYTKTRSQTGPQRFLEHYRGFLQADAYSGYDKLYATKKIIEVACFAHARRKFVDVVEYYQTKTSAERILVLIQQLYAIETQVRHMSIDARYYMRRHHAKPILKKLYRFMKLCKKTALPNSLLDKALNYSINHWQALCNYLRSGDLEIDNNRAERAMRLVVLGRKNYLFAGSHAGAEWAAIFYSLIYTCQQHQVNVSAYFKDILSRLPSATIQQLPEFLPYHWVKYRPPQSITDSS